MDSDRTFHWNQLHRVDRVALEVQDVPGVQVHPCHQVDLVFLPPRLLLVLELQVGLVALVVQVVRVVRLQLLHHHH